jgi:glutaredoxin
MSSDARPTLTFTLYTRPGCHLCDDMKAVVAHVQRQAAEAAVELMEVDISADPALESRYGLEIPVLVLGGRTVARHRVTGTALARIVADRIANRSR